VPDGQRGRLPVVGDEGTVKEDKNDN
jgi:hypothetical protein